MGDEDGVDGQGAEAAGVLDADVQRGGDGVGRGRGREVCGVWVAEDAGQEGEGGG